MATEKTFEASFVVANVASISFRPMRSSQVLNHGRSSEKYFRAQIAGHFVCLVVNVFNVCLDT